MVPHLLGVAMLVRPDMRATSVPFLQKFLNFPTILVAQIFSCNWVSFLLRTRTGVTTDKKSSAILIYYIKDTNIYTEWVALIKSENC